MSDSEDFSSEEDVAGFDSDFDDEKEVSIFSSFLLYCAIFFWNFWNLMLLLDCKTKENESKEDYRWCRKTKKDNC